MSKFTALTEKQKEARDKKEARLYELGKKLSAPSPEAEELERRTQAGEIDYPPELYD
ncbi:MAG TPA: hypothetical protein VGN56_01390 [Candidatus Paceibacterota bacterium]|nr:hypothetical protein [Candidatus Paceibacterota bacterium]